jgi:carbonic anhydrase
VFTILKGTDIELTIDNMPKGADFENLGTTVEVITQGGTLKVANTTFKLKQFHFHLPSEHLDNGTSQASLSSPLLFNFYTTLTLI